MLHTYEFLPHGVQRLHGYIAHLVLEVWCKPNGPFDISMLHSDFVPIVQRINAKHLLTPIQEIYTYCQGLTDEQLARLAEGFVANNDIEGLCNGSVPSPLLYDEIRMDMGEELEKLMKSFFKGLYEKVLTLSPYHTSPGCGRIDDYYKAIIGNYVRKNRVSFCPFCGLEAMETEYDNAREAFDHYLPKGQYPFSSVNFWNLAPSCNKCNSRRKLEQDPIFEKAGKRRRRRRAFYPFALNKPEIDIRLDLKKAIPTDISEIAITISSVSASEEVEGWKSIFGIEQRYRATLCRPELEASLKRWLEEYYINYQNHVGASTNDFDAYLQGLKLCDNKEAYEFFRVPYIQSCHAQGFFNL